VGQAMLLGDLLDFGFSEGGEVGGFGGDDALKRLRMVGLQIVAEEDGGVAGSGGVADEDDRSGVGQIVRDGLVPGVFFRNALAFVVGFFAVNEVVLKSVGVVGLDGSAAFRAGSAGVVPEVGDMMIDDDNDAAEGLRRGGLRWEIGGAEKVAEAGNLIDVEVMGGGAAEDLGLGADGEGELIVAVGLDGSDLADEIDNGVPGKIARELAAHQAFE